MAHPDRVCVEELNIFDMAFGPSLRSLHAGNESLSCSSDTRFCRLGNAFDVEGFQVHERRTSKCFEKSCAARAKECTDIGGGVV